MTNDTQPTGVSEFKDRKAGLIVFGIIQLLFGIFCLLTLPLLIFGMHASSLQNGSAGSMNPYTIIPSLLFYCVLAVWFFWLGIGSILARRWARALLLITSWIWLVSGILGLGFVLFLAPSFTQMGNTGQLPHPIAGIMKFVMIGVMTVFYIIIPGAFVLFYGSRHVKATCERRDPHVRWTDKRPLPVLAVSLLTGIWVFSMPMTAIYGWPFPFFGTILSGKTGAGVLLVTMVVLGYVSRGFYKLDIRAWWCAVVMVIAWGVSFALTFSRVSISDFFAQMDVPPQQMELMTQISSSMESLIIPFCLLWVLIALAYLFCIKKYLLLPAPSSTPSVLLGINDAMMPPPIPSSPITGNSSGGLAIASLVLGVLAVLLGIIVIGVLFGFLGLILGVIHLLRSRSHRALAGWGVALSIVGSLMAIAVVVAGVLVFKHHSSL